MITREIHIYYLLLTSKTLNHKERKEGTKAHRVRLRCASAALRETLSEMHATLRLPKGSEKDGRLFR